MMKRRIIIAGGSGFIGQALAPALLEEGYELVILTRSRSRQENTIRYLNWDGRMIDTWTEAFDGAFALVNLAGRSINCRHTSKNRRQIIASRIDSVRVLGEAIARCAQPPAVFVQAAGIGIYGDKGGRWCNESTSHGDDFLTEVCEQWEAAFDEVATNRTRKVLLRLGVVLGPSGGFLEALARLTRAFLGGQVGHGRQFISWIHVADLTRLFLVAFERDEITGVFNATSPGPVTNATFMRELRRILSRPWSPPVPKSLARLGAWLLGTEAELALVSQRCVPQRLLENNFTFLFPALRAALASIYPRS